MELSVIVVSYNEKQYIHQAIESILNQSFKDYEIIIGDDGSCDGSQETIRNLSQKYSNIKYFIQDRSNIIDLIPSFRVSNIIKKAISKAEGRYIICLSADDYFIDNDIFQKHIENLDNDKDEKYSASVSAFVRIYEDGRIVKQRYRRLPSKLFWATDYLHISCFMFRKKIYENGYFLDNFCDDSGLVYSLVCAGKFIYTNTYSFAYRQRAESIMHKEDNISLDLLRLMLFTDILSRTKQLYLLSLSRFNEVFINIYKEYKNINYSKHKKYLNYLNNQIFCNCANLNSFQFRHKVLFYSIISKFLNYLFRILTKCIFYLNNLYCKK